MGAEAPRAVGRLAPTPSGDLHLGNAAAFLGAWLSARHAGGEVVLRMEDVDIGRARREVEARQRADLAWLGLRWDRETTRQSERDYAPWRARVGAHTYACTCTRAALRGEVAYPGTCRDAGHADGAIRLRLPDAAATVLDRRRGPHRVEAGAVGDPILRRRDGLWAYPLAVVADDIADGITEVVRGADLLDLTAAQAHLWALLGATPPTWLHTPLVLGPDGRKLSKSHGALHLGALREAGWGPDDVLALILPWLGLPDEPDLRAAADAFDPARVRLGPLHLDLPHGRAPTRREGVPWQEPARGGPPAG